MYFYSIYFYNLQYIYVVVYMYSHMTCSDCNLSVAAVFICVLLQVVGRRRSVSSRGAVGLHVKVASTRPSRRRGGWLMGYWETRLSRDEAGRRAVTNCMYMCTDRATVIVVSPCHCMIDLVKRVRQGACM